MEPSYVVGSHLGQKTSLVTWGSHDLSVCLNSFEQGKNYSLRIVAAGHFQPGRDSTESDLHGCARVWQVQNRTSPVRADESATSLGSLVTLFFRLSGRLIF